VRFSWPASLSVALGAALALGFGSGTASISVTLRAPPALVRADGDVVAAAVPGDRKGHCAQIVLWRRGHAPVTITTIVECDNDGVGLDSVDELALAGRTVAWQESNGGNNLELSISKATLAKPKEQEVSYVENGGGAADDPAGDWTGSLVGHGGLVAYASWSQCDAVGGGYARTCSSDRSDVYAQRLVRVDGRVLLSGADAVYPVWTDGHAILVRHADRTLALVDSAGRELWRHSPVRGLVGVAFQGSQLVTLTRSALAVWKLPANAPRRVFRLSSSRRVLEDLDGGLAVLGSHGTTHLIRLSDGRGATFAHVAHAQLEPEGLFFSDGRTLRFVPRARIHFG